MKCAVLVLLTLFGSHPCWSQSADIPSKQEINELVQKADEKVTNFEAANESAKTVMSDSVFQKGREAAATAHVIISAIQKNGPSAYALVGLIVTLDDVTLNAANGAQGIARRAMADAVAGKTVSLNALAAADALNVAQSSLTDISELVSHATLRLIKAEENVIQKSGKQE
jgi:hypothetical protein